MLKSAAVVVCLLPTESPAPVWTGNSGDPLRFAFEEGRQLALTILELTRASSLPVPSRSLLTGERSHLISLTRETRYGWNYSDDGTYPNQCFFATRVRLSDPDHTCAVGDYDCGPALILSFSQCQLIAKQRFEIARNLVAEACAHRLEEINADISCQTFATDLVEAWRSRITQVEGIWRLAPHHGTPQSGDRQFLWAGDRAFVWGGTRADPGSTFFPQTERWSWNVSGGSVTDHLMDPGVQATWNGKEVFIWRGDNDSPGALFNIAAKTWRAIETQHAPKLLQGHQAVRLGNSQNPSSADAIFVWGAGSQTIHAPTGEGATFSTTFNGTGRWQAISSLNAPSARINHLQVWTGERVLVWGGQSPIDGSYRRDGGMYDPHTNTWEPIFSEDAPAAGRLTGTWMKNGLFVWNEDTRQGSIFQPQINRWRQVVDSPRPIPKDPHVIWAKDKVLLIGKINAATDVISITAYDPLSERWDTARPAPFEDGILESTKAVWSGSALFIWGRDSVSGQGKIQIWVAQ